ncbi:hypothetical protein [Streptomyces cylindrosporus]|uniref:Uncharacterized protein n=1 Tax=Streptomyces cylindrosporus TaxID=2927583 RepID=A0ABS9Y546_9ACTN|nr:hypothetical protein [Streptomyces cylindrosporus]MCI3272129.1 hypothetical protein [Streptomyces cylindrosporus]
MTSNELLMLAVGLTLGMHLMNAMHAYWGWRDDRRSAARTRADMKRSAGDRYLHSLRIYQLQHRSRV